MNKFKTRTLLAGAVLGMAMAAGPAQAELFAYSKLDVTNFQILGSNGNVLDYVNDFNSIAFTSSADMDGVLTGTGGFNFNTANSVTGIDFPTSCLSTTGNCNPLAPDNSFPFLTGPQGTDFVAADQEQTGSPLANTPNFPAAPGANVGQIAAGNLANTSAAGSANVNNGLEASWTFTLAQVGGITFTGAVDTYIEAFISAGELFPGKAAAGTTFIISITDLQGGAGIVFNFAPGALNQSVALNANGFGFNIQQCGILLCGVELNVPLNVTTGALLANNLYQLSIRSNANIDIARRVPEPGILGLMGLGLMGIFLGRRRRA